MSPSEIDRYYRQIGQRVDSLLERLRGADVTNETVEGRVRGIAEWLDRELAARRLPIPLDRSYWGLVPMLIASRDMDHIPQSRRLLIELRLLLDGEGVVEQPRDNEAVAGLLGRFVDAYLRRSERPTQVGLEMMEEFQRLVAGLEAGTVALPLDQEEYQRRFPKSAWFKPLHDDDELADMWLDLSPVLFSGRRPGEDPVRFEAPVPGLPAKAPLAPKD